MVQCPCRRVIFRHPYMGKDDAILSATKYRQMCGRAGRKGAPLQACAVFQLSCAV